MRKKTQYNREETEGCKIKRQGKEGRIKGRGGREVDGRGERGNKRKEARGGKIIKKKKI